METEDRNEQHFQKVLAEHKLSDERAELEALPLPADILAQILTQPQIFSDPYQAALYFIENGKLPLMPEAAQYKDDQEHKS